MVKDEISFKKKDGYTELSAVGQPSDFYVYDIKKSCPWSGWIKSSNGSMSYWNQLLKLKKSKDRQGFQNLVDYLFEKFPHDGFDK